MEAVSPPVAGTQTTEPFASSVVCSVVKLQPAEGNVWFELAQLTTILFLFLGVSGMHNLVTVLLFHLEEVTIIFSY